MGIVYASLEDATSAMDVKETARMDAQVMRQLDAASRSIEALCHRTFYPTLATRYFGWPDDQSPTGWRLWLDESELLSVTTLSSGGVEIASADYFLEPQRYGPPYSHIELDLASSAAWGGGPTHQRDITVTGTWGYCDDTTPAGSLAEALDASETSVDVTDSAAIGIGHLVKVDDERMRVTGKSMLTTGQTINGALTASTADRAVLADDGTAISVGETILIDSEQMTVDVVAGNTLTVRRAVNGSVLAAHSSGATVYAPRTLVVERGVLGTTAATHSTSTAISRHVPPAGVEQLCIDETVWALQNTRSGMARVIGSGDNERQVTASSIRAAREQVYRTYGRMARKRAI